MTNAEAIIEMQLLKKAYCNTHTDAQLKKNREVLDAYDSAIKALEQEPCEDCISRQAVMDCFKKWQPYMATRIFEYEQELKALPSIQPKPKTDVLDKIRAEIATLQNRCYSLTKGIMCAFCKFECKYKAESEGKE